MSRIHDLTNNLRIKQLGQKALRLNVRFKSSLNQLSLSHKSNKKAKKRKTKQKSNELIMCQNGSKNS